MRLMVNGNSLDVDVDNNKPLLWVLREELELTGTKYGCGIGYCGGCTVLIDGIATQSCQIDVGSIGDAEIITIEGLNDKLGQVIKKAWVLERAVQCGYCQPGQIISAYALLSDNPDPSDIDIDRSMINLCRCGTYQRIRAAIKRVSTEKLITGV